MRDLSVLVVTNMYPGRCNPSFGSFVKVHADAFGRYTDVKQLIVANTEQRKGMLKAVLKYAKLILATLYRSIFTRFDVVHAHYAFPTGFIALIAKYIRHRPLIITVHGGDINEMAKRSNIIFNLCGFTLKRADALIAVSDDIKHKLIEQFHVAPDKVYVVNMGVDTEIFKPMDKADCRAKLGIKPDKKVVLFVGNIIARKGVVYLIEAVGLLKKLQAADNMQCVLLGNQPDQSYMADLRGRINELGIGQHVRFVPSVPYNEVAVWMNAADVFVLPSLEEPFGLVALEALACGVPVIATTVGGLKEFIKSGETGYSVPPRDSKAIANSITEALFEANEGALRSMKANGRKFAQANSVYNQVKRIKGIYDEIIERTK